MKLTRLRIAGFKSFVEPTDFLIEPGLTGVIGPNGCGKSNLVEALRWVMGESSYKSMRASGMDDVIFSGTNNRAARNTAEVTVSIDNIDHTAPAGYNDGETLEISRRIERETGSIYRINGREVRARDVQLLFADAATGARSPALVRQGQINEIIAAKPQSRRRILEDAAGIAGLHTRRHEAELRLKGAEENLLRTEDVLREIDSQIESLKRQGRQAARYKTISAEIRRCEALSYAIAFAEAREESEAARRQMDEDLKRVAEQTEQQTKAATAQALAAHDLPLLREKEAAATAALQRLNHARAEIDAEERRSKQRLEELAQHLLELEQDLARNSTERADALSSLTRLKAELETLTHEDKEEKTAHKTAHELVTTRSEEQAAAETVLMELQAQISDIKARRSTLDHSLRIEQERHAKLITEQKRIEQTLRDLTQTDTGKKAGQVFKERVAFLITALAESEKTEQAAREALASARNKEEELRQPLQEAQRIAQKLETEVKTLAGLLSPTSGAQSVSILDDIITEKGYEIALGAAFGEDLDASTSPSAPVHWRHLPKQEYSPLPEHVLPLSQFISAPAVLTNSLSQIGVVESEQASALQKTLQPGQTLVSRDGGIWRWDGFTAAPGAPTPAARRLAEKNRLGDLEIEVQQALFMVGKRQKALDEAHSVMKLATDTESKTVEQSRSLRRELDQQRTQLAHLEKQQAEVTARTNNLKDHLSRLAQTSEESAATQKKTAELLKQLPESALLELQLAAQRVTVANLRALTSDAKAALQNLDHQATNRAKRRDSLIIDIDSWTKRLARAEEVTNALNERLVRAQTEQNDLSAAPDTYLIRRRALIVQIETAEAQQRETSDTRVTAEKQLAETDKAARQALDLLSRAREARAGSQARHEAALRRVAEITHQIADSLSITPSGLIELAGLHTGDDLPSPEEVEKQLFALRADRERLGAVNLRAEDELKEIETKKSGIITEKSDLEEAIKRLRQAISNLNREGRERLLAAFDTVNDHFKTLFTTLFSGGTAELTLVDSDDPLEAGLEILARPPGKKPQTMTLLSGGEQALTAIALIFAVFLTNPSPICVLDEVDAPLDDANVERYCDLLMDMAGRTETRFIVITHNPITMARMNRLYGVTMAEKGISQLVSVDLESAEQLVDTP